jgi:transketolase
VTKYIAIEMGASSGWCRYVGTKGEVLGIDQLRATAPGEEIF